MSGHKMIAQKPTSSQASSKLNGVRRRLFMTGVRRCWQTAQLQQDERGITHHDLKLAIERLECATILEKIKCDRHALEQQVGKALGPQPRRRLGRDGPRKKPSHFRAP